jgi:hypothetical protein
MTNVYEGKPDQRQSDDSAMPTSRFRPRYRALEEDEKRLHDAIKAQAEMVEALYGEVVNIRAKHGRQPQMRELALAMTKLEESVMWAVKALTA